MKTIAYLIRDQFEEYGLYKEKPQWDEWDNKFGLKYFMLDLCSVEVKKFFGLKRHLAIGSKTILKVQLDLKVIK